MSDESTLTTLASGLQLIRYASVGSYALIVYEFLIVFDRELETIHKSRWSLSKSLYYGCRFCPLLSYPIIIYTFLGGRDVDSCKVLSPLVTFFFMLFFCFPHCVFTLGAWAFTRAKRPMLLIYVPCLFGYIAVVFWASWDDLQTFTGGFLFGKAGCFTEYSQKYANNSIAWISVAAIALDTIVGLTIVVFCYTSHVSQTGIGKVVVGQGLLYYPFMLFMNVLLAIVLMLPSFHGHDALAYFAGGILLNVVVILSNIMACRFMIQIREFGSAEPISVLFSQ